ncbi:MAG TPA: DUF3761 domain-containing protein [Steroidobacteraceae bacterium]|nr:DUF3761 domain-containing protein [Steroidobacteraceae bacterium]
MKNITIAGFVAAPLLAFAMAMPSFAADPAPTTCKDGTTTTSTGKGTCSGHGGVLKAMKAKPATAAATAAPATPATPAATPAPSSTAAKTATATKSAPTAAAGNTDPAGATAKCKDGTYSKSAHRSGTCSSHGGVAEWLTAAK